MTLTQFKELEAFTQFGSEDLDEETKEKIRQKALGRKTSDETREKLSKANKNKVISRETVLKRAKTIEQMVANGIYEKVGFILIRKAPVGESYQA